MTIGCGIPLFGLLFILRFTSMSCVPSYHLEFTRIICVAPIQFQWNDFNHHHIDSSAENWSIYIGKSPRKKSNCHAVCYELERLKFSSDFFFFICFSCISCRIWLSKKQAHNGNNRWILEVSRKKLFCFFPHVTINTLFLKPVTLSSYLFRIILCAVTNFLFPLFFFIISLLFYSCHLCNIRFCLIQFFFI